MKILVNVNAKDCFISSILYGLTTILIFMIYTSTSSLLIYVLKQYMFDGLSNINAHFIIFDQMSDPKQI